MMRHNYRPKFVENRQNWSDKIKYFYFVVRSSILSTRFNVLVLLFIICNISPVCGSCNLSKNDLTSIEEYLTKLTNSKADFIQVNPDGNILTGVIYISLPGKMRIDYHDQQKISIIFGFGEGYFVDRKLHQTTRIPISNSPFGIIMNDPIDLHSNEIMTDISYSEGLCRLTTRSKKSPVNGSLELIFTDFPFALRKWIMVDEQRQEYVFSISEFIRLSKLSDELFRLAEAVSDAPTSGMR